MSSWEEFKELAYETRYGLAVGIAITLGLVLGGWFL